MKILVCHKDDNPKNNNVSNLFIWSHKDNTIDMVKKGRHWRTWLFWKESPCSKKVNQYTKNLEFIKTWDSLSDVKRELWIDQSRIMLCCKWLAITTWNFKWKYT